jgi:hypothetical protein
MTDALVDQFEPLARQQRRTGCYGIRVGYTGGIACPSITTRVTSDGPFSGRSLALALIADDDLPR